MLHTLVYSQNTENSFPLFPSLVFFSFWHPNVIDINGNVRSGATNQSSARDNGQSAGDYQRGLVSNPSIRNYQLTNRPPDGLQISNMREQRRIQQKTGCTGCFTLNSESFNITKKHCFELTCSHTNKHKCTCTLQIYLMLCEMIVDLLL